MARCWRRPHDLACRKFDVAQVLRQLPRSHRLMGVPTYYVRLLAEAGFTRALCAHMRLFISGSAPLLTDTFQQFIGAAATPYLSATA